MRANIKTKTQNENTKRLQNRTGRERGPYLFELAQALGNDVVALHIVDEINYVKVTPQSRREARVRCPCPVPYPVTLNMPGLSPWQAGT